MSNKAATDEICQLFHEDEVSRLDKKGNIVFGTVLRDYEMVNQDDSEEEDGSYLKKGEVLVSWYPKFEEKVHPNATLKLGNRSLMPGDVVRRMNTSKKRSQAGYCRELHVRTTVAIKCSNNKVLLNINSTDLKPLQRFPSSSGICLEPWVGVIRRVRLNLTLAFHDGVSRCVVDDSLVSHFDDVNDKEQRVPLFKRSDYYPGMTLSGPLNTFEGAEWLTCSNKLQELRKRKPRKFVKVTVLKTEVRELSVNWQCQAFLDKVGSDPDSSAPDVIKGEDLEKTKLLGFFLPCTAQIGDRFLYTIKEEDIILSRPEWMDLEKESFLKHQQEENNNFTGGHSGDREENNNLTSTRSVVKSKRNVSLSVNKLRSRPLKKRPRNVAMELYRSLPTCYDSVIPQVIPGETVVVEVLRTTASVSVLWQDGSLEEGIDSSQLYPMHHLDDNEFFTGEFVVRATDLGGGLQTYGVIQSLDYRSRIAKVKWFRTYTMGNDPSPISDGETEESVYDLRDHPDFNYRPGSVVIKVANFDNEEFEVGLGGEVVEVYPNGKVTVRWANDNITECWPQDLYKVGEYDSDDGELWDDEDDEDSDYESPLGEKGDNRDVDDKVPLDVLLKFQGEKSKESHDNTACDTQISSNSDSSSSVRIFNLFEKTRTSFRNLEEAILDSSKLQSFALLYELWDIYTDCRSLDNAMETSFFALQKFSDIVDRINGKGGKLAVNKLAAQDQVKRLFSNEPNMIEGNSTLSTSTEEQEDIYEKTIRGICSVFNTNLGYIHKVIVKKYGMDIPEVSLLNEIQQDKELDMLLSINGLTYGEISPPAKKEESSSDNKTSPEPIVAEVSSPTSVPQSPLTTESAFTAATQNEVGNFRIQQSAPEEHTYKVSIFAPLDMKNFLKFVKKEVKLLSTNLPSGIFLKGYEDRIDLFSAMIMGPPDTPYQDGLFFFDFQLPPDYPKSPPFCHYHSYCSDRLNPNLYEEGKVCVSLLGTWSGKGTETWTPNSNLLQLLLSIQGLILVKEPYFNEAGYESQKSSKFGQENSWMYNEMVVIKIVQSMTRLLSNPPPIFSEEIKEHIASRGDNLLRRWKEWLSLSKAVHSTEGNDEVSLPKLEFPLLPASMGFCLSLSKSMKEFEVVYQRFKEESLPSTETTSPNSNSS